MALVLVSHDLSVVSQMSDRIAVVYAGQVVEQAPTEPLLSGPRHPYSAALLRALPGAVRRDEPLAVIPGSPPQLVGLGPTCRFAPRCPWVQEECRHWETELLRVGPGPTGPGDTAGSTAGETTADDETDDGRTVRCRREADVAAAALGAGHLPA